MAQDVHVAVVGTYLKVSRIRAVPPIQDLSHHVVTVIELKADGALLGLVAGVALYAYRHHQRPFRVCSGTPCFLFFLESLGFDPALPKSRWLNRSTRQARNTRGFCRKSCIPPTNQHHSHILVTLISSQAGFQSGRCRVGADLRVLPGNMIAARMGCSIFRPFKRRPRTDSGTSATRRWLLAWSSNIGLAVADCQTPPPLAAA